MWTKHPLFLLVPFSFWLVGNNYAFGYPSMVRHGYTTCATCHVNSSGGGSLRAYGKFVAGETMGVFNTSANAWPWIKEPVEKERFFISFFGRTVQTLIDNPKIKRGDLKKMQADIEAAYEYKRYVATITVGPRLDSASETLESESDFFVRRFYVGRQAMKYSMKVGMFFPEFGIYMPNHNLPTRKGLFFNHNQETWIAQASRFSRTFDYTAAYLLGVKDSSVEDMSGYSGTIAYKSGSSRYGVSGFLMEHKDNDRKNTAISGFATVGYHGLGYTMIEVAKKSVTSAFGKQTDSLVGFLESGWEVYKGLVPYFIYEYTKNETFDTLNHSPGLGLQLGIVTHFEIMAQASKTYSPSGEGYALFSMFNIYF